MRKRVRMRRTRRWAEWVACPSACTCSPQLYTFELEPLRTSQVKLLAVNRAFLPTPRPSHSLRDRQNAWLTLIKLHGLHSSLHVPCDEHMRQLSFRCIVVPEMAAPSRARHGNRVLSTRPCGLLFWLGEVGRSTITFTHPQLAVVRSFE